MLFNAVGGNAAPPIEIAWLNWCADRCMSFPRGTAIGWWVCARHFRRRVNAYISTVAVLPEYQKRGIGRELIHACWRA